MSVIAVSGVFFIVFTLYCLELKMKVHMLLSWCLRDMYPWQEEKLKLLGVMCVDIAIDELDRFIPHREVGMTILSDNWPQLIV